MLSMRGHVMALPCFTLALNIAISTEQFVLVGLSVRKGWKHSQLPRRPLPKFPQMEFNDPKSTVEESPV